MSSSNGQSRGLLDFNLQMRRKMQTFTQTRKRARMSGRPMHVIAYALNIATFTVTVSRKTGMSAKFDADTARTKQITSVHMSYILTV